MNKRIKRIAAAGLCAVLVAGNVGATPIYAAEVQQSITKDETVYVLAGADGAVQKIIVSDWLKNSAELDEISDVSALENIENVKGYEAYTTESGENIRWEADGKDIYYQGNVDKELPVTMTVTYKLDNKVVSAEELAGKSGKVTIRFDYENHCCETIMINGQEETLCVPFAMLTGMLLDNDTFRNVEVKNGKLVNDGNHTFVVGVAFPGLQENLSLEQELVEIPDYVEVTAEVTEFAFGMTFTLATNEVFQDLKEDKLNSESGLKDAFTELTDAMNQLMDGSDALYDGLCELYTKSDKIVNGAEQLASGTSEIKYGVEKLDDGAGELKTGILKLSDGLNTLSSQSAMLTGGAEQVFQSLLATATAQIKAAGIDITDLTIGNYAEVLNNILAMLQNGAGSETIVAVKASLDSYNTFYQGICAYTQGVDNAASSIGYLAGGAAGIKAGTEKLKEGSVTLYNGALELKKGIPQLTDGIRKLKEGSATLSDGLKRFNEQGVQKLADVFEGDLETTIERAKKTIELSRAYDNFAGIAENTEGQVKFIYRTEEIKAD